MTGRQRQRLNWREKRALTRILLATVVFSLLVLFFAPNCGLRSYWLIQKNNKKLSQENNELMEENLHLKKEISRIQHDDRYLEQIARKQYNMLRKNEEVYYTAPPSKEQSNDSS